MEHTIRWAIFAILSKVIITWHILIKNIHAYQNVELLLTWTIRTFDAEVLVNQRQRKLGSIGGSGD